MIWDLVFRFIIKDFILSFIAVIGFSFILNNPRNVIIPGAAVAAASYVIYDMLFVYTEHMYLAYFAASVVVAVFGEMLARLYKMPAVIFILPGIIPLVPGVGLYNTILRLIENDFTSFVRTGAETLFIACAISAAIAIVNMIVRTVFVKGKNFRQND